MFKSSSKAQTVDFTNTVPDLQLVFTFLRTIPTLQPQYFLLHFLLFWHHAKYIQSSQELQILGRSPFFNLVCFVNTGSPSVFAQTVPHLTTMLSKDHEKDNIIRTKIHVHNDVSIFIFVLLCLCTPYS